MTTKTLEAIRLSHNLTSDKGVYRFVGTRYSFADPYDSLMRQGIVKPRIYTATKDGTEDFSPSNCVYLSSEQLHEKRKKQGPWSFNCQMLMRPQGDATQGFKREWIKDCIGPDKPRREGLIPYIFVDPANSKKPQADYTAMWVIGFAPDKRYIVLDMLRDRLSLAERADRLLELRPPLVSASHHLREVPDDGR